jgi:hypothetical protein
MASEPTRSEQVVAGYKQRKLGQRALRRIHELIQGFEEERAFDWRMARIGLLVMVVLVSVSLYFVFSGERITLG